MFNSTKSIYVRFNSEAALKLFTRESSYCFQRVLAIAILSVCPSVRPSVSVRLSVCHTGRSVTNGAN